MMKCGFSIDFSMTSCQNKVLRPSKSTSKTHISSFVTLPKSSFGEHTIEKSIESRHFIFCSVFQNLRLGTIK